MPYIDWQFFFHAWELKGKYPAILDNPAARELFDDATELLDEIVRDKSLQAHGVYGFWPAHAEGDDVVLDEGTRFSFLRQQTDYGDSRTNRSLADYVAPAGDHLGAFAVSIHGADELAGATRRSRTTTARSWSRRSPTASPRRSPSTCTSGRATSGATSRSAVERGSRRRALPRHPAGLRLSRLPRHSEKPKLFELVGANDVGMELTENFAPLPAASVSGLYFHHPEARYFSIGRLGRDQVEDYAARRGIDPAGPNAG